VIKAARNLTADAIAHAAVVLPPLERLVRAAGRHVQNIPIVGPLHRRTRDTVTDLMRQRGRGFRLVEIGGVPLIMDVTDFTCHRLYFHGEVYEPLTVKCVIDCLRPGGTFVDVGANHGYFTVLAARLVGPSGRVIAFEPNPPVLAQLQEHLRRNTLTNVTPEPLALSDTIGSLTFFVSSCPTNSGLSSSVPEDDAFERGVLDRNRTIQVSATTFDDWNRSQGVGRIDLMKIDVEGGESSVLRGMAETFAELPPDGIICEMRSHSTDDEVAEILTRHGYTARALDESGAHRNVFFTRGDG
jgi:FkbM family methyltransferase